MRLSSNHSAVCIHHLVTNGSKSLTSLELLYCFLLFFLFACCVGVTVVVIVIKKRSDKYFSMCNELEQDSQSICRGLCALKQNRMLLTTPVFCYELTSLCNS